MSFLEVLRLGLSTRSSTALGREFGPKVASLRISSATKNVKFLRGGYLEFNERLGMTMGKFQMDTNELIRGLLSGFG